MWQDEALKIKTCQRYNCLWHCPLPHPSPAPFEHVFPPDLCFTSYPVLVWVPCAPGSCPLPQMASQVAGFVAFFHVQSQPNAQWSPAAWRTKLLNVFIDAPTCSLTNVCGSFSLGQHCLQVTGGEVRSRGKKLTKRMLHKGKAVHVELSTISLHIFLQDKASHLKLFFHLLKCNDL